MDLKAADLVLKLDLDGYQRRGIARVIAQRNESRSQQNEHRRAVWSDLEHVDLFSQARWSPW